MHHSLFENTTCIYPRLVNLLKADLGGAKFAFVVVRIFYCKNIFSLIIFFFAPFWKTKRLCLNQPSALGANFNSFFNCSQEPQESVWGLQMACGPPFGHPCLILAESVAVLKTYYRLQNLWLNENNFKSKFCKVYK